MNQTNKTGRIQQCFSSLIRDGDTALVTFVTAGDPDYETSLELVKALPGSGADLIELGMPFSDPMADGPAVQASSQRALKAGQDMRKTLELVRNFRTENDTTPIILMGYYNPIYVYPTTDFLDDAKAAGVDGLIIVDVPPEADEELCIPAIERGINFIRLATPTTDEKRLSTVLNNTSGFVYYVSITGITGTRAPEIQQVSRHVEMIKRNTDLPVAVGFGVKTAEQARSLASCADGVVVGSKLVSEIADSLDSDGRAGPDTVSRVLKAVEDLSIGLKNS